MLTKVLKKVKMRVKMRINKVLIQVRNFNKIKDKLSKAYYLAQVIKINYNLTCLKNQMKIKKGFGS
jgi:hypothetical protein